MMDPVVPSRRWIWSLVRRSPCWAAHTPWLTRTPTYVQHGAPLLGAGAHAQAPPPCPCFSFSFMVHGVYRARVLTVHGVRRLLFTWRGDGCDVGCDRHAAPWPPRSRFHWTTRRTTPLPRTNPPPPPFRTAPSRPPLGSTWALRRIEPWGSTTAKQTHATSSLRTTARYACGGG